MGIPESRKWKQIFDEFVGYNNEHGRKRKEKRYSTRDWGEKTKGKNRIKNDSKRRGREKAEHRKEEQERN